MPTAVPSLAEAWPRSFDLFRPRPVTQRLSAAAGALLEAVPKTGAPLSGNAPTRTLPAGVGTTTGPAKQPRWKLGRAHTSRPKQRPACFHLLTPVAPASRRCRKLQDLTGLILQLDTGQSPFEGEGHNSPTLMQPQTRDRPVCCSRPSWLEGDTFAASRTVIQGG